MQIPDITNIIFNGYGIWLFKIPILLLMFIYMMYTIIIINRIKSLNQAIQITSAHASKLLKLLTILQFIFALSLFLLTIAIV